MAIVSVQNVTVGFGGQPVLDTVTLHVEPGERVCLLGSNGTGKSTLLKVISGELSPDSGTLVLQNGARIATLPQNVPLECEGTVFEIITLGLGPAGTALRDYHRLSAELERSHEPGLLDRLHEAQHALEKNHWWHLEQQVEKAISRVVLDPDAVFGTLSGGMKRRVLLRAHSPPNRTFSFWMSPRTIWISTGLCGLRSFCAASPAQFSSSPTTAPSSRPWPHAS